MLKPQKKISKKELKEDKFVKTMMETRAYIEENSRTVTLITAAVLAVIISVMLYNYFHAETLEKSSTLLGEAQVEYQNMSLAKAERLLVRLMDEYSGTNSAAQGRFLLGNIYYQQNKIEAAKEEYLEVIDSYSGSDILTASGYAGYGACLEREKNYAEAAEYYTKARNSNKDFVDAADYLYLAALNYIQAEQYEDARNSLHELLDNYENSDRKSDAESKLILIEKK